MFTECVHKLKQCTNLILYDENYTPFVVLLLVHKMGGRGGRCLFEILADRRGTNSKGKLIPGGGGVLIRGFTVILLIDIDLSITYFFSNHRFSSIGHPRVSVLEKKNKTKLTGERGNGL